MHSSEGRLGAAKNKHLHNLKKIEIPYPLAVTHPPFPLDPYPNLLFYLYYNDFFI